MAKNNFFVARYPTRTEADQAIVCQQLTLFASRSDFEGDVLHVQWRMYDGKIDTTKSGDSERRIPITPALLERMRALEKAGEWIFHGRRGVALNPG